MASVTLVSPSGREFAVSTVKGFVDAVYGRGAVPKVGGVRENYEALQGAAAPQVAFGARVGLAGLTESAQPIVTSGTAVTVWSSLAFDAAAGHPVTVALSGGHFTAAGATFPLTVTFDLYDPIAGKTLRQAQRTVTAAAVAEPVPSLRRLVEFPTGPRVIQFRIKPSVNTAVTVVTAPTAPDESPLQLIAEEGVYA